MSDKVDIKIKHPENTKVNIFQGPKIGCTERIMVEGNGISVSDGYHTFEELYDHRVTLWIKLCRLLSIMIKIPLARAILGDEFMPWKSLLHSDGSKYEGWFIMGVGKSKGNQITYHLPIDRWDDCMLVETIEKAPDFDGHTSADVLERLKKL